VENGWRYIVGTAVSAEENRKESTVGKSNRCTKGESSQRKNKNWAQDIAEKKNRIGVARERLHRHAPKERGDSMQAAGAQKGNGK